MTQLFRIGVVLVTLGACNGCMTLHALDNPTRERIQQNLELGDDVRVTARNGKTYGLHVDRIEADSFTGRAANGKRYKVPYTGVEQIEIERFSALGTVGAGAAVVAIVGAVALIVALHSWDFHFSLAFCE